MKSILPQYAGPSATDFSFHSPKQGRLCSSQTTVIFCRRRDRAERNHNWLWRRICVLVVGAQVSVEKVENICGKRDSIYVPLEYKKASKTLDHLTVLWRPATVTRHTASFINSRVIFYLAYPKKSKSQTGADFCSLKSLMAGERVELSFPASTEPSDYKSGALPIDAIPPSKTGGADESRTRVFGVQSPRC